MWTLEIIPTVADVAESDGPAPVWGRGRLLSGSDRKYDPLV